MSVPGRITYDGRSGTSIESNLYQQEDASIRECITMDTGMLALRQFGSKTNLDPILKFGPNYFAN